MDYLLPGTRTALHAEETARCYSHPETQLQLKGGLMSVRNDVDTAVDYGA